LRSWLFTIYRFKRRVLEGLRLRAKHRCLVCNVSSATVITCDRNWFTSNPSAQGRRR